MRGIRPPALFELRAHEWRNAVDLHHLPEGTHSLAPRPGSLVRLHSKLNRPRPPDRSRNRKRELENEDENDDEEQSKLVRVAGLAPALAKV